MIATDIIYQALTRENSCDLNTETPTIEMISPLNPKNGRNLEYRNNWKIVSVTGIDELADITLTTELSRFRSGVIVKSKRKAERTITITVKICQCEDCDMYDQRKELYDIVDCKNCSDDACLEPCADGTLCLTDYAVKDARYCIMRVRCCGVVRDFAVQRKTQANIRKGAGCHFYTFDFVAPNPNNYHPSLQSACLTVEEDDLICPTTICTEELNLRRLNNFKKCVTIPYAGNVTGYPKFIVTGDVLNLKITNNNTGSTIDLNNRDAEYSISGCGITELNFWRGQQVYRDSQGNNIYADLRRGCNNDFFFSPDCGDIELCIEGEQVDVSTFFLRVDWWNEFDGLISSTADSLPLSRCDYDDCEDGDCA